MDKEEDLIRRMQAGEASAFKEFDRDYDVMFNRFIHKHTKNKYHAKAIKAEVNVAVWKGIKDFNNNCLFSTWLFRITERTAIAYFKKEGLPMRKTYDMSLVENKDFALPEQIDRENPLKLMMGTELDKAVRAAVKLLPELQGIAITLRYLDGCSIEETAIIMDGRTEVSVKMLAQRGMIGLAVLLKEYKDDY